MDCRSFSLETRNAVCTLKKSIDLAEKLGAAELSNAERLLRNEGITPDPNEPSVDMHVVYLQFKVDVLIRPEAAHLLLHPVFQEKSPDNWKDFQEKLCTVKTMLFGNETRRPSAIVARLRAVPLDAFRGQIAQFFPTLCSLVIGFDVFDKSIPLTEDIVDVMQRAVYGDDVERELLAVSCVLQCLQIRTRILEDLHPLKSMLESIHALLGADE